MYQKLGNFIGFFTKIQSKFQNVNQINSIYPPFLSTSLVLFSLSIFSIKTPHNERKHTIFLFIEYIRSIKISHLDETKLILEHHTNNMTTSDLKFSYGEQAFVVHCIHMVYSHCAVGTHRTTRQTA